MSDEKQIEEMAETLDKMCDLDLLADCEEKDCSKCMATALYNAGYRKQSEGEWILQQNGKGVCSKCNRQDNMDELACFCRYCGARMGGGAE